ncbi:pilus assembly protein TadG-related protein [Micromonospora auratinigra]|uniref:Putative Flp pilus-assembly TadE/G-like n=1 Tax=Micromonospora auratinigra TaxID=261654 RepID=A0A1A9A2R3_9ACTN|nr:pilus assembly protein TadG-related protein [Micromonospora auratinigra]SBT50459.1 Putative Flp pilus-assembly TadE/G-like [Micromonospora auratinigra]
MTGRPHRESGRVSLFLAAALTGVLVIIGLAYDTAGQLRSLQRADNLAAEAARSGGQMIDRARAIEGGPKEIDEAAAQVAVADYLRAAGGVQSHTVSFPVVGGEKQITVRVRITYRRDLLGLFGISDTVTVTGEATARALTGAP